VRITTTITLTYDYSEDDLVELRGHCDPNDMAMAEKLELKSDLSSFITTRLEQHGGSWTGDVKVHEDSW